MYGMLSEVLTTNQIGMLGIIVTFLVTFLALRFPLPFLPQDHGREFAVNGALSRGKTRGVGLLFVICFLIGVVIFVPIDTEMIIYGILLVCMMLSGYLDDASDKPWSEYKKGLIDLVISVVTVVTFLNYNSPVIFFGSVQVEIPGIVYGILGIILIWVSVNVTNCSDGVDGLCASLCIVVLIAFNVIFPEILGKYAVADFLFAAVLLAYLYFNSSPSSMLMGDAGSRALGFYIAIIAMKSQHPFLYLLIAAVPGFLDGFMQVYQQVLRGGGNHPNQALAGGIVQLVVRVGLVAAGAWGLHNLDVVWLAWPLAWAAGSVLPFWFCRRYLKAATQVP